MRMDKLAGSKNDEFYTPKYAVLPILQYLKEDSVVWCPFDDERSQFVVQLREAGHTVIATHLWQGVDFFTTTCPECDYIISNPPYSLKNEVFTRLFDLGKPFAMLVGIVGLFESRKRVGLFSSHDFEVLYLAKRVSYFRDYGDTKPALNPPFQSAYVTRGVLPKQILFAQIDKKVL